MMYRSWTVIVWIGHCQMTMSIFSAILLLFVCILALLLSRKMTYALNLFLF